MWLLSSPQYSFFFVRCCAAQYVDVLVVDNHITCQQVETSYLGLCELQHWRA